MIISSEKEFVFFSIRKCGSSSLDAMFQKYHFLKRKNKKGKMQMLHLNFEQFLNFNSFFEGNDFFGTLKDYFKFAFVRNPYDKAYSAFLEECFQRKIKIDFNEGIGSFLSQFSNDFFSRKFIHFEKMHTFTHHKGSNKMDFIGRIENFEEDINKVAKLLNLDIHVLKARSRFNGESQLNKYTANSVKLINEFYAKDFEYFNYPMLDPKDFPESLPPNPINTEDLKPK